MGGDYGLQKLFGTFGAIIWGPISGKIIGKKIFIFINWLHITHYTSIELWFSKLYIFATLLRRHLIFQAQNSVRLNNLSIFLNLTNIINKNCDLNSGDHSSSNNVYNKNKVWKRRFFKKKFAFKVCLYIPKGPVT